MISIKHGDCMDLMRDIPDGTIDFVCADVPYGTTRCKWDSVLDLELMWLHLGRVCKKNAAVCIFSAQPFTSVLVSSNIKNWRTEWIWEKGNATGFLNAKKQPLRAHENIQVFYSSQPTYNPQMNEGQARKASKRKSVGSQCYGIADSDVVYDSTSRYPRDVQRFSSDKQKSKLHPTQKPLDLIKYLIKTYTNQGDTVLDFTMGSGTAAEAAIKTGRSFVGFESDIDYFMVAKERIERL